MSAKAGSANLITGTRILCSIALLFCQTFSPPFFALYIIAGLTDMIDGTVARKAGTVSEFGAKLDTAADFALVAACLIKMVPVLELPVWLWLWTGDIALVCGEEKDHHTAYGDEQGHGGFAVRLAVDSADRRVKTQCAVRLYGGHNCSHTGRTLHKDGKR